MISRPGCTWEIFNALEGLGVRDFGFRGWGSGLNVYSLGVYCGIQGLGFSIYSLGSHSVGFGV